MKSTERLIRSPLQVVVLLGVLGAGGAWGQGLGTEIAFKNYTTDKGCVLAEVWDGTKTRNHAWTGECRNGKVWGKGVLTYETYNGRIWEARWADVGQFNNEGHRYGNWMVVNRINKIIGFAPFQEGERKGIRFLSQAQKPETLAGAREYLDEWTKGKTDTLVPFLMTAVTAYFEDHANFYKGDFAKNGYADSFNSNANNPQTNSADEPKVFGRSARGG